VTPVGVQHRVMSTIRRPRVRLLWIAVAVMGGAALAGCGSTGTASGTVTNESGGPNPAFLPFAKCMRANGVPNMPDRGQITPGSGINPSSPAFQRASQACRKQLPGGGPPAHASEQQKQQLFATSRCMRENGVSGFPDPITANNPPTNPQNYSIAEGLGDLWLLVPSTINVNSPAFRQAAKACAFH
jgi:hypothetical protein